MAVMDMPGVILLSDIGQLLSSSNIKMDGAFLFFFVNIVTKVTGTIFGV